MAIQMAEPSGFVLLVVKIFEKTFGQGKMLLFFVEFLRKNVTQVLLLTLFSPFGNVVGHGIWMYMMLCSSFAH